MKNLARAVFLNQRGLIRPRAGWRGVDEIRRWRERR